MSLLRVGLPHRALAARNRTLQLSRYSTTPGPSSPPPPTPSSSTSSSTPSASCTPRSSSTTTTPSTPRLGKLYRYAPRLAALSARTRVPLPSLALSFLILHELTAIVPVVGLYYLLHWLGAGAGVVAWLAGDSSTDTADKGGEGEGETAGETTWQHKVHEWYAEGAARAERVGRRYGILGYEKGTKVGDMDGGGAAGAVADAVGAYVLVKALLPARIAISVAVAPAFARVALNPIQRALARFRK